MRGVQEEIKEWTEKADKSIQWVVCPNCGLEYNKLKPCRFIWNGKMETDSLCINCAQGTNGINTLLVRYPLDDVEIEHITSPKEYMKVRIFDRMETVHNRHHHFVLVTFQPIGDQKIRFRIQSSSVPPFLKCEARFETRQKVDKEKTEWVVVDQTEIGMDNILAILSWIRMVISRYSDPSFHGSYLKGGE